MNSLILLKQLLTREIYIVFRELLQGNIVLAEYQETKQL
jgi:hypothetical protein